MKKLSTIIVLLFGLSFFGSCNPDSIADQEYEYTEQATDKDKNGTVGNQGGNDPDEDHN